jgi:murein DD-endopeptidase MepM/ murein hydrolase activator NlpD
MPDATNGVCSHDDDASVIQKTPPLDGWTPPRRRTPGRRVRRFSFLLLVPLLFGSFAAPSANLVRPVGADELADAQARQDALAKQLRDQKAQVSQIAALQSDLSSAIATTKSQLNGINADLAAVRVGIGKMVVQVAAVQQQYNGLVDELTTLDGQLTRLTALEERKQADLIQRKAILADRIRTAYDTDRTTLLETFLSGGSFTDVIAEVSYINDFAEQDKMLAQQIVEDQATLATIHATVQTARIQTDALRVETAAQKVELDKHLAELKSAQAELKALEKRTADALKIQKAAYAKLLANKKNLAKAIAAATAAKRALASKISDLIAKQYAQGNIPSDYNGTLRWPMPGTVTQPFGCTGFAWEPPYGDCPHFHQGIDIVAPEGTAVRASGNGRVAYCGWNYADGADPAWIVIIAHSSNLDTWYAHMKPNCPVATGAVVHAGQVIGHEGNTGHSTGAHLHWAVRFNGNFVNPRLFL